MADVLSGVALVTGGGRGIGAEIARGLAARGMRVAVTGRTAAQVEAVAAETGGLALVGDVTDRDGVDAAVTQVERELGPIDLLVANAGVGGLGAPSWEQAPEDWWHVLEVNLLGPFLCARAVLPGMVARGRGRVVVLSSNAAFYPVGSDPDLPAISSAYMASKAALTRFAEALAAETAPHGVRVFAVSPGMVWTQMTREVFADWPHEDTWSPPELTADLVGFIATGALDRLSGRYLHARNEDWRSLPARADEVLADDLLALRLLHPPG